MQAFALIDYDNVKTMRKESSREDVYANIEVIVSNVISLRREHFFQNVGEIVIRLYGSWITESGHHTRLATWVLSILGEFRGRRSGIRIRSELATSLLGVPEAGFVGTQRRLSGEVVQKLVDSMMVIDLFHLGVQSDCPILIHSDDDDLVPPVLYAAVHQRYPMLLRSRAKGLGLNDHLLERYGLIYPVQEQEA